jgi:hypothetical protein
MNRRQFLKASMMAFASGVILSQKGLADLALPFDLSKWRPSSPYSTDGPAPRPEITAVVDVIVPADPEVPNDFTGSDYHADWVLAATLGDMGQLAVAFYLNKYARQIAGRKFLKCTPEEKLEALRQWIREREDLLPAMNELLTGVLTISMIGTYEENTKEEELELFESMGWYDPDDPAGTFRLPNEGYADSFIFPAKLKKGIR